MHEFSKGVGVGALYFEIFGDNLIFTSSKSQKSILPNDRDVSFQILVRFQTFDSTPLKITFEMSSLQHVLHKFMVDSDFQKTSLIVLFQTFSLNLNYIPANEVLLYSAG